MCRPARQLFGVHLLLTPGHIGLAGVRLLRKEDMLRRDNYSYKKYQKELAKKKKKEEKKQSKLDKKNIEASNEDVIVVQDPSL